MPAVLVVYAGEGVAVEDVGEYGGDDAEDDEEAEESDEAHGWSVARVRFWGGW